VWWKSHVAGGSHRLRRRRNYGFTTAAFGGRPVRVSHPVVGDPKVGALLRVVERKDHRAVDPIVVEIPQQADEVELTPIAIPAHVRVRVPDRCRLQHAGGQATQVGDECIGTPGSGTAETAT
jgi:hypothetical protein